MRHRRKRRAMASRISGSSGDSRVGGSGGPPGTAWSGIAFCSGRVRPVFLWLVPVEDGVFAVLAVAGRFQIDAHAQAPWRGFRAGLSRGPAALDEDGLAGAVDPVSGSGLEDGQLALQTLDLGQERIAGGALPPGSERSGGPEEAGRGEHDGD